MTTSGAATTVTGPADGDVFVFALVVADARQVAEGVYGCDDLEATGAQTNYVFGEHPDIPKSWWGTSWRNCELPGGDVFLQWVVYDADPAQDQNLWTSIRGYDGDGDDAIPHDLDIIVDLEFWWPI